MRRLQSCPDVDRASCKEGCAGAGCGDENGSSSSTAEPAEDFPDVVPEEEIAKDPAWNEAIFPISTSRKAPKKSFATVKDTAFWNIHRFASASH